MKKRALSLLLVLSVAISLIPFAAINASAASSDAKTLLKTKTVSIKPGKTYKTPKFNLSGDLALQVPLEAWLSSKDKKKPGYIKKGGFTLTLYKGKGKKIGNGLKASLKRVDKKEDWWYSNWFYWYDDDENNPYSNPGVKKGKYYYTIKNTTNRIIKVKYSVRGFTEIASTADFPSEMNIESGYWTDLGKIGPGMPLLEKISFTDTDIKVDTWDCSANGEVSIVAYGEFYGTKNTTLEIKLRNREEPYVINVAVTGEGELEDESDEDYEDNEFEE